MPICNQMLHQGARSPMSQEDRQRIMAQSQTFAHQAYRVLAVAMCEIEQGVEKLDIDLCDEHVRRGMAPDEARRQALIKLGGIEQTKQIYRDRRSLPLVESLIQDVRYGLRTIAANKTFSAMAILSLALGIGANTAIFGAVEGVLLRPLPYDDPSRLVMVWERRARNDPSYLRTSILQQGGGWRNETTTRGEEPSTRCVDTARRW